MTGGGPGTGGALGSGGGSPTGGASNEAGGGASVGGLSSSGGSATGGGAAGGAEGDGGAASGGSPSGSGGGTNSDSELGTGVQEGMGTSNARYETVEVNRNQQPYILITNGWGPGFQSQTISYAGTSFTVESLMGDAGSNGQPATYPTVFCGRYSVVQIPDCGLPQTISSIKSLKTGWRWSGPAGHYNAAYDIWVGTGTQLQGYLMVWLRDPPPDANDPNKNFRPAGALTEEGVSVEGLPGVWNIWTGTVNNLPITNWVRAENDPLGEIEFDVMDVLADAAKRGITYPGTSINSVAVGFEIWEGPVGGIESEDFYVRVE